MLGAMIGDIAGSKYEFNNTFDYDFEMFGEGCDFTDDTICTVAIADAILNGRSYQESLLDWCRRYPSPKGAYGGRFAGWIRSLDPQPYNSFGNGSAMRVSPVAWLFDDLSQVLEEAEKTARQPLYSKKCIFWFCEGKHRDGHLLKYPEEESVF